MIDSIDPGKYEYIMKACAIMANGELSFSGSIEISRFMIPLKSIGSKLKKNQIQFLAKRSGCGSLEEEEGEKKFMISF